MQCICSQHCSFLVSRIISHDIALLCLPKSTFYFFKLILVTANMFIFVTTRVLSVFYLDFYFGLFDICFWVVSCVKEENILLGLFFLLYLLSSNTYSYICYCWCFLALIPVFCLRSCCLLWGYSYFPFTCLEVTYSIFLLVVTFILHHW